MTKQRKLRWLVFAFAVMLAALAPLRAGEQTRTLQSFGVTVQHGQPVYPHPPNVTLGLFDTDPLLDLAYYTNGNVQVWRNLGNGLLELAGERRVAANVARMEWKKERMWSETLFDQFSWGVLHVAYDDGSREAFTREHFIPTRIDLTSLPQIPTAPPIDFREVWRSPSQTQPSTYIALADVDSDGRIEIAYCFFPQNGDSNRFVVYEHVGNDSFRIEWDTVLVGGFGPLAVTDIDRNGKHEWVIVKNGVQFLESEGNGRYRRHASNIQWSSTGYITKGLQTDINRNGIPEVCIQQSNPSPPPGIHATYVYIAEFAFKSGTTMSFNIQIARYYPYTFDMAVGQIDGTGWDEIIPSGGSFGFHEPVPIDYLYYNGTSWVARQIHTGLESGTTAPMFVNLDADTTMELFIGAVGPVGHGSCYALKHISDTTWSVLWADSSLANTPLWANAGVLRGENIVAGANTLQRAGNLNYSQLHTYLFSGTKLGFWQKDTGSIQNFHFIDLDGNGKTNLVFAQLSIPLGDRLVVYEETGSASVSFGGFGGSDNSPLTLSYPNPFNSASTIQLRITTKKRIVLQVFDILGREVKTLINETLEAGNHMVTWSGTNNKGGDAGSGVYLYRLIEVEANGEFRTYTRKVLLIR